MGRWWNRGSRSERFPGMEVGRKAPWCGEDTAFELTSAGLGTWRSWR